MKRINIHDFFDNDEKITIADKAVKRFDEFINKYKKNLDYGSAIRRDEMRVLAVLLNKINPGVIIETGTNWGISTAFMALNSNAQIYTFDIPHLNEGRSMITHKEWGKAFLNTELDGRIMKYAIDTFELKIDTYPAAQLWFIDSGHDYKTVNHETALALKNMDRGMIVWHDAKPNLPWGSQVYDFLDKNFPMATLINTDTGLAYYEKR